jgi:hypothetical protein
MKHSNYLGINIGIKYKTVCYTFIFANENNQNIAMQSEQ